MRSFALALCIACGGCMSTVDNGGGGGSAGSGGGGGSAGGGGGGSATGADAHQQHNLDTLNMYRAQAGIAPLAFDAQLSQFSLTASMMLESTMQAHGYFMSQSQSGAIWTEGFCNSAAENQGPGWPTNGDEDATTDAVLQAMIGEGPTGGHYENIMNAQSTRVGIGLVVDAQGALWLTNDFSSNCP